MPKRAIDMTGMHFGRLTVLERAGSAKSGNQSNPVWLCRCDCGEVLLIRGLSLRSGNTKSCGCLRNERRWPQYYGPKNNPEV